MAMSDLLGVGRVAPERLAIVEDLLANNPGCAVGVFDLARNLADAAQLLADVGIPLRGH